MRRSYMRLWVVVVGVLVLGAAMMASRWIWPDDAVGAGLKVPAFSTLATQGKTNFDANCASCHGVNATGTANGPPLIHDIYNPGHHADEAFFRAAKGGVPQHHWRFGNMARLPNVTDKQLVSIIRYVREMQEANGIFYRKHVM